MIFKDYYKILGLDNNKASASDIKSAYREQAKKYHPDINSENSFSEERFKDINEAYKVLSDATARRKYDRMWNSRIGYKKHNEESKREEGSVFSNFFNMFFGNLTETKEEESDNKKKKKIPKKGEDIETEVEVSISEAFYGANKKIALRTMEGRMKTFTIKIPEGIRDGEKIRLLGQGKSGKNGGNNGDLFIKIHIVSDEQFVLKGIDIYTYLLLTPWEAALGTTVMANTIDESVSLHIPEGTQSGEKVKILGKGYKDGRGGRGELILEVKIMIPKNMSEKERKLFEELKEVSEYNPRSTKKLT